MNAQEKAEYLRYTLTTYHYANVAEGINFWDDEDISNLLDEGRKYLRKRMESGRNHWEALQNNTQGDLEDLEDDLREEFTEEELMEMDLSRLMYYAAFMRDSSLSTDLKNIEFEEDCEIQSFDTKEEVRDFIRNNGTNDIKRATSKAGNKIWEDLEDVITPRNVYIQDEDHVYFEFWCYGNPDTKYHEREGESKSYPNIRKVSANLHLDKGFIELRGRNERERDIEDVKDYISSAFDDQMEVQDNKEIESSDIEDLIDDPRFVNDPHSGVDGPSKSQWSNEQSVRQDDAFPENRDYDFCNMQFEIPNVGILGFQISAEDNQIRVFKHNIKPKVHQKVVEFIWGRINA